MIILEVGKHYEYKTINGVEVVKCIEKRGMYGTVYRIDSYVNADDSFTIYDGYSRLVRELINYGNWMANIFDGFIILKSLEFFF